MKRLITLVLGLTIGNSGMADVTWFPTQWNIEFKEEQVSDIRIERVSFPSDAWGIRDGALSFIGANHENVHFWLKTEKIRIARRGLPTTHALVDVVLKYSMQRNVPMRFRVYVRYGFDGNNWSSWMLLEDQNSTTKGNSHHRGQVRVPDLIARAGAAAEAAARSQHIPLEEFLSSEHSRREEYALDKIPFFGYIEIHIEDDSSPTYFLNLKEIRVEAESSGLSGRNEELFEREKWNFELRSGGTLRGVNCE